jgi:L-rhamnose mutarotase
LQRICFVLRVRPDRIEEYRSRHRDVWPEMQAALAESGWHNYSLFLRKDGLLVGYLNCENFEDSRAAMRALEVNTRWQQEMAPFFVEDGNPDDAMQPLEEVFHLE